MAPNYSEPSCAESQGKPGENGGAQPLRPVPCASVAERMGCHTITPGALGGQQRVVRRLDQIAR